VNFARLFNCGKKNIGDLGKNNDDSSKGGVGNFNNDTEPNMEIITDKSGLGELVELNTESSIPYE
jgi:hypothetical protein